MNMLSSRDRASAPSLVGCIPDMPPPVLEGVSLKAVLEDLLANVEVHQTFRNRHHGPIEAVYTFPVPHGATLLSFTAKLGRRELAGRILPAAEAEDDYEEAVTSGDAAILLQEASPGMYTVNVGNLLPDEKVELTYRYAQLQHWQSGALRFALPTVIAPRYGDPAKAGLEGHQVPEHDMFAHHSAEFSAGIRGVLQDAEITCPTHGIVIERQADGAVVRLEGGCAMDRDIVLVLKRAQATPALALFEDMEGGGRTALLTFVPETGRPTSPESRFVKVLVDCSGSMQGDSIGQARVALRRILDSLRPQDYFSIMAFGSTHRYLTPECAACTPEALKAAREAVAKLDADLGGTELRAALLALMKVRAPGGDKGDVLLVTDGETFDDNLTKAAAKAGGRVFTVGVGCAPGASLLERLSEQTKGAAEFVTPGDDIAGRIHRHFQRLYQPRVVDLAIRWPGRVVREQRAREGGVFAGDTVHIMAQLADVTAGDVVIGCRLEDGTVLETRVALRRLEGAAGALPGVGFLERLMAAAELEAARLDTGRDASAEVARLTALAVRCQLMSPWTSCLMVALRDWNEKTDGMPDLVKVPQMLAAGWQGNGGLRHDVCFCMSAPQSAHHVVGMRLYADSVGAAPWGLDDLPGLGVPGAVVDALRRLVDGGDDESLVCLLALHALLKAKVKPALDREQARLVRRLAKLAAANDPALAHRVAAVVASALPAAP